MRQGDKKHNNKRTHKQTKQNKRTTGKDDHSIELGRGVGWGSGGGEKHIGMVCVAVIACSFAKWSVLGFGGF